ncbi:hypothetical protein [Thermosulfuriphilus sp.]
MVETSDQRGFVCLDCEGPITQNDNAFELAEAFIPRGGDFFARVSRYDDFLADVVRRPGYKAGDTLRLILPFLKAFGLTNEKMRLFSKKNLKLLPGARELLTWFSSRQPTFIISTSYRPYLEALCEACNFPLENVFCTEVDLDEIQLPEEEHDLLKELAWEIVAQPLLDWPEEARGPEDLPKEMKATFLRLEEIFFEIIPGLSSGRFLKEVNPIGGPEKARATKKAAHRSSLKLSQALYVGDSITDTLALEEVRRAGGLAVSFNGNRYALKVAEVAVIADDVRVLALVAEAFFKEGHRGILRLIEGNSFSFDLPPEITEGLSGTYGIYLVSREEFTRLVERSEQARRAVRGLAIGALG